MTLPPIALTGRFRSGKDSVGAYLTEKYGYTRFAFGDELKRHYRELFGDTDEKDREGLQWFGQKMRERDPDIWIRKCFGAIDSKSRFTYSNSPFLPVITDLRQPNELDRCRAEGYVIIRISCPEENRIQRAIAAGDVFNAENLTHDTESHVDTFDVDYDVDNNGTLAELYAQIDAIMAEVSK